MSLHLTVGIGLAILLINSMLVSAYQIVLAQIPDNSSSSWVVFSSPKRGIEISHPNDWQADIEEITDIPGDYLTTVVTMYPAAEGVDEEFLPVSVTVDIDNSVEPLSLDQYLDDSVNAYSSEDSDYEDVKVLQRDSTSINLAGKQGYSLTITADFDGEATKILDVGTIHNGKPYFITYNAEEGLYDKYLPIAQKMISSFKFTK